MENNLSNDGMTTEIEQIQTEKQEKQEKQEKKTGKKTGIIIAVAAVVIIGGCLAVYFLFFTPAKRLERKLNAARDAFADENYKDASDYYEDAVDIDAECLEAMVGDIKSDIQLKNKSIVVYERYLKTIQKMDAEDRDEDKDFFIEFYMLSEQMYEITDGKLKDIMLELYKLYQTEASRNVLIDIYMKEAQTAAEAGQLKQQIEAYDNVLVLDSENQTALSNRATAVKDELKKCIVDEDYDEAEKIIGLYKDTVTGINYEEYIEAIEKGRYVVEKKLELLGKVEEIMSGSELNQMSDIDGSELANFVSKNIENHYIYTKGESADGFTGKAAAIYKFSNEAYYFYYGDFVNGVREGTGKTFMLIDEKNGTYESYDGKWANDLPNGNGNITVMNRMLEDQRIHTVETGNFTDGYENGDFDALLYVEDKDGQLAEYTGKYTADMGQAADIRDTTELVFNIPKNYIMYLIYYSEDGSTGWGYWYKEGTNLGVKPFCK